MRLGSLKAASSMSINNRLENPVVYSGKRHNNSHFFIRLSIRVFTGSDVFLLYEIWSSKEDLHR